MKLLKRLRRRQAGPRTSPLLRPTETPQDFDCYLFICELHRSGTTLLEALIDSVCDCAVLRADVPENEGQHLQDVFPSAMMHGGPGRFAFAPEMHPAPSDPGAAVAARQRLLSCWTPFVSGDKPLLLEKSPPNLTKIAWLRSVFPAARFVILTRDPRAVAAATRKWTRNPVSELIFHWHVAHDAAWRAIGPDCHHVRYEDLCADPDAEMTRLISALDLPRRTDTAQRPERFARVTSSNEKYLSKFSPIKLGAGAWDHFGYDRTYLETAA